MRGIATRIRARGLAAWGATWLPRGGSGAPLPATPQAEAKRQAVNAWIRTSGAFDQVVDLDAVMRDPARPDRLRAAFDSGDHTHPNDAGARAMAEAVAERMTAKGPAALSAR